MRTREDDTIDDILDEFDFGKVQKAMELLEWTWAGQGYPTIGEMRKTARGLLKSLIPLESGGVGTGGFVARKTNIEGEPFYELSFVLTSWASYD